jgi:hypothetical protein
MENDPERKQQKAKEEKLMSGIKRKHISSAAWPKHEDTAFGEVSPHGGSQHLHQFVLRRSPNLKQDVTGPTVPGSCRFGHQGNQAKTSC